MNQPEDILNIGDLENLPDYTIFKKKTPALKRYPSSARKTLGRWYLSFVKNNNPRIKYKYWISVNGYLNNKTLIQSSPILDVESPLVITTANTKYYLINNSDVLKNPPHSRFDLTELAKFKDGFPPDWENIIIQQLTGIFGSCRIKSTGYENDKILTPFDKIYNDIFVRDDDLLERKSSNEDDNIVGSLRKEIAENMWKTNSEEFLDERNKTEMSDLSQNSSILVGEPNLQSLNNSKVNLFETKKTLSLSEIQREKMNASYISNSSKVDKSNTSAMNSIKIEGAAKYSNSLGNLSFKSNQSAKSPIQNSQSLLSNSRSQILNNSILDESLIKLDKTVKMNKQRSEDKSATSSEEIEIVSKSVTKEESPAINNLSDIFLEDNINNILSENINNKKLESNKSELKINQSDIKIDISEIHKIDDSGINLLSNGIKTEGKSFDNVMNAFKNQKLNKQKSSPRQKKESIKDQFAFDEINFGKSMKNKSRDLESKPEENEKKFSVDEVKTNFEAGEIKNKLVEGADKKKPEADEVIKLSTSSSGVQKDLKQATSVKIDKKLNTSFVDKKLNASFVDKKSDADNKLFSEQQEVSDFFVNSSFNVPEKDSESMITNISKLQHGKKKLKEVKSQDLKSSANDSKIEVEDLNIEDYLQDSHIIESILNLGNVIENSSFKPNDSDKVNLSVANKRKKTDEETKKKHKDSNTEKKENTSMLQGLIDSGVRRPYSFEKHIVKKESTPKKKKSTKVEDNTTKIGENKIKLEEYSTKVQENTTKVDFNSTKDEENISKDEINIENSIKPVEDIVVEAMTNNKIQNSTVQDEKSENIKDENKDDPVLLIKNPVITNTDLTKEIEEIKRKFFNEEQTSFLNSDLEFNATTHSQKLTSQPKKKKKGRTSLCMPKKPSTKKVQK